MKAVRIHGPGKVSIDEVPIREPGEYDVLIKVKAAGLFGTDYELYTNDMVYIKEGLAKLPIIPGHEWSGIVEKVGKKVSKFKEGDKISGECTVNSGKCEFCLQGRIIQCIERTETGIMNREECTGHGSRSDRTANRTDRQEGLRGQKGNSLRYQG